MFASANLGCARLQFASKTYIVLACTSFATTGDLSPQRSIQHQASKDGGVKNTVFLECIILYSSFFLPLPFVAIIIVIVSVMFFWRPKERKAPAHGT
jgi:hypothetical protein